MSEDISEVTDEAFESALSEEDVQTEANVPASSDETVVVAPEAEPEVEEETPAEPEGETPEDAETPEPEVPTSQEVQLNWDSAPEQFREKYKAVKGELTAAQQNTLKEKYFESADAFLDELNALSEVQFQQTTQQIVQRGIDAAPDPFAEYMATVAPDALAKAMAKVDPEKLAEALNLGMPLDKALKVIAQVKAQDLEEYLSDGTEEVEKPKATKVESKPMTTEDIDKLVAQKIAEAGKPQAIETLRQETYADIMKPVEDLLSDAGLTPLPTDSEADKEFKEWASQQIIRDTFSYLLDSEQNAPQAKKMIQFIENLDKAGVKHLASTAKIKAEDYAGKRIEMLTSQRAKAKSKGTEPKKIPPKVVPAGVPSFGNVPSAPLGRVSEISDAEFESVGL